MDAGAGGWARWTRLAWEVLPSAEIRTYLRKGGSQHGTHAFAGAPHHAKKQRARRAGRAPGMGGQAREELVGAPACSNGRPTWPVAVRCEAQRSRLMGWPHHRRPALTRSPSRGGRREHRRLVGSKAETAWHWPEPAAYARADIRGPVSVWEAGCGCCFFPKQVRSGGGGRREEAVDLGDVVGCGAHCTREACQWVGKNGAALWQSRLPTLALLVL